MPVSQLSSGLLPEFRSFDGSGNNLTAPSLNAAGTEGKRLGTAHFGPGGALLDGPPNARLVSNTLADGGPADLADRSNALGVSDFVYVWGQFLDHDLDRTASDGVHHIDIHIAATDPVHPGETIPMTRFTTGASGQTVNAITGWIDGSMIYGSDAATAASLRTSDGHMLTSAGNNLPIVGGSFVSGDIRVTENPDLTALTALFAREHNAQVDKLAQQHHDWTGDQLYNQARAIVGAEIANITYSEFLPHLLGGPLPAYAGYNPAVDPRISEEFADAAYRFGHSIISGEESKVDIHGNLLVDQDLADAVFDTPNDTEANGGIDALLRHLPLEDAPENDVYAVDALRNSLPGQIDLISVDVQRERDVGIGTLNETRTALGLTPYTSFEQVTSDPVVAAHLQQVYGTPDKVDLFMGGLAENHVSGGLLGETFTKIISGQFQALRDGDRLWFENSGFDQKTLNEIKTTTLADILKRDTDSVSVTRDVFTVAEHGHFAGADAAVKALHASRLAAADFPKLPSAVAFSDGGGELQRGQMFDTAHTIAHIPGFIPS